jgi:hypothetical protein
MNSQTPHFRRTAPALCLLTASATAFMLIACFAYPGHAAEPDAVTAAIADLQAALDDAAHESRLSDDLDPAYRLLGIAETAQRQNLPDIAAKAATTFADLVKRSAVKALRLGGTTAEDTLDQFVDLRFVARTANLPLPQAALDDAMANLFPVVSVAVQQKIDDAGHWADKLKYARELADLQASAAQILKTAIAQDLGAAFDSKMSELETLAGRESAPDERHAMLEDVAKMRKLRDDRLVDANANNLNVVAALMSADKETESATGAASEVNVPEELAAGTTSCIETGIVGKADAAVLRGLRLNCINSGRLPAQKRCSMANLAFLCYAETAESEKITYVYRGTPEELYFQLKCGSERIVPAGSIPESGPAFRTAAALAFTCAPSGSE